ncbi:sugar phosphate isomerase/epimerase family protein [Sphingomonas sp. 37zxx]|uniref:sugar phosphate isomerase/epimerase family protein n=1 Tax=Sphingomonas sp. 37zxx TaxID=1550073 RepID=UPI00068EC72A|nr:sugar phosphate isomerase/epimerase [Sphingomonas sp. 37zxx]
MIEPIDQAFRAAAFSRRSILGCGLATALIAIPASALPKANLPAGIQLWTVRNLMQNSAPDTLRALAGIGYDEIEISGFYGTNALHFQSLMRDFGLTAPSMHVKAEAMIAEPQRAIEDALILGSRFIVLGALPKTDRNTLDSYRLWSDRCNVFGAACRASGLRFAYHNHAYEFDPIDGVVPYDLILERTDSGAVGFELDFYWAHKAGRDIKALIARAPKRFWLAHLKDAARDGAMADVGQGVIPFAAILKRGMFEHHFVERDDATAPLTSAAASYSAVRGLLNGLH